MNIEPLKPCPFCGSDDMYLYPDGEEEGHSICGNHKEWCHFNIFAHETEGDAMNTWNKRQSTKEEIVDCVYKYIDRMGDFSESDTAERILEEFTAEIFPVLERDCKINHGCPMNECKHGTDLDDNDCMNLT